MTEVYSRNCFATDAEQMVEHHNMIEKVDFDYKPKRVIKVKTTKDAGEELEKPTKPSKQSRNYNPLTSANARIFFCQVIFLCCL